MDTQYTALARRFRPQTFSEVVGQERIAQTLRNAILENRVAHAYLFTGARGVGKTSMARIFAKALNCPNTKDGVPCNECEICRGISAGNDVDVSEIDGASNRGIDDIRSLRANVNVRSMRSKYKVYIIDEVHMLTKEAFNALLKTLEEPPPLVKFVFCTTEPNKVPDTILSRCQRFDFGTISTDNIEIRLSQLAEAEGFTVDQEALELVARRAAGSMRDSQSLFDQLLAFGAQHITAADVHRLLGTAPDQRLIDLIEAMIDRRRDAALSQFQVALNDGVQLEAFTDQLLNYFRDLMVAACGAEGVQLLSVGRDCLPKLQEQSRRWGLENVVAALQIFADTKGRMQRVTYGRALAELALVRLSLLADMERLDDLLSQLKAGNAVVASGTARPTSAPPPRLAASTSPVPAPSLPAQKKNERLTPPPAEVASGADSPVTGSRDPAPIEAAAPPPVIAFQPGLEAELHRLMLSRLTDMTGTHLAKVVSTAISGPNRLDFSFSASYDIGRKACERPEVQARLESLVKELTGQDVRIQFRTVVTEAPEAKPQPAQPTNSRRKVVESPEDPLVQEVAKTFGIERWLRQEVLAEVVEAPAGGDLPEE
ncbi:DNA polymerase III subunit gamma/tau [Planctellipticum variicoloris]|uniref:DNA polymerase III subunit gamma/tau n=1 Tax=Planctellipticum variicoloris TaxID=3064265 RepID=UPI002C98B052|nr:DNA polymerase III subunit gamma/tau [Planctomycetaceae bacterium SH412]HTN04920.1 DNA polymerase III subunit gamma/tau [Planctomycetaceae bacterium]